MREEEFSVVIVDNQPIAICVENIGSLSLSKEVCVELGDALQSIDSINQSIDQIFQSIKYFNQWQVF